MEVSICIQVAKKKIGTVFHEAILNTQFTLIDQTTSRELYKKTKKLMF